MYSKSYGTSCFHSFVAPLSFISHRCIHAEYVCGESIANDAEQCWISSGQKCKYLSLIRFGSTLDIWFFTTVALKPDTSLPSSCWRG